MTVYLGEAGYPKPRSVRLPAVNPDRLAAAAVIDRKTTPDWPDGLVLVTYWRDGEVVVAYTTRARQEEESQC